MTTLDYLEVKTAVHCDTAVIWLHGLGADAQDFAGIVPSLNLPQSARIQFIFPNAPVRPVTLNAGMAMRAWYDIYQLSRDPIEDEVGIGQATEALYQLIAQLTARGIAAERLVLGGFSQGAALALYAGLCYERPLAGIMALSGYVPLHKQIAARFSPANHHVPIFMAHGRYDLVLPINFGYFTRNFLLGHGYKVDWHEYPMDHGVCPEEVNDIGRWLGKVLLSEKNSVTPG
jgi:phospholipase/carboxylesterase